MTRNLFALVQLVNLFDFLEVVENCVDTLQRNEALFLGLAYYGGR
jgi:hypothetical protein